jgi:hypothetical protein
MHKRYREEQEQFNNKRHRPMKNEDEQPQGWMWNDNPPQIRGPLQSFLDHTMSFFLDSVKNDELRSNHLEIEAKLGLQTMRDGVRLSPADGSPCQVLLSTPRGARFKSGIEGKGFRRLNMFSNRWVNSSHKRRDICKVLYKHPKTIDWIYKDSSNCSVRETRDMKTGEILRCGRKIREKLHLNFLLPKMKYDIRITASAEVKLHALPGDCKQPSTLRFKDRMSYQFCKLSFDITEVKTWTRRIQDVQYLSEIVWSKIDSTWEVELELDDCTELKDPTARKTMAMSLWQQLMIINKALSNEQWMPGNL